MLRQYEEFFVSKYLSVVNWDESSLEDLPAQETDEYEYKSSEIVEQSDKNYRKELKEKVQKSASAFWNSGGGYFIVGYDEVTGNINGGIPDMMGNQGLRDWVDNVIHQIEPVGKYEVRLIASKSTDSLIDAGNVVLVIGFAESRNLPHMSPDHRYYIRAGAHSVPAKHFIVESLRAFRSHNSPVLRGLVRYHPDKKYILELVVTAITDVTALDVQIDFNPRTKHMADNPKIWNLPLQIPIIDKQNPFTMDITLNSTDANFDIWGEQDEIQLNLTYQDSSGKKYEFSQSLNHKKSRSAVTMGSTHIEEQTKELRNLNQNFKQFTNLARWFQIFVQNNILPKLNQDNEPKD